MSSSTPDSRNASERVADLPEDVRHELGALQQHWWAFLILGIGLVLLGTIALSSAAFVSVAAVALFGVIMVVGGIAQVVSAFWAGRWSGFFLQMLFGILYVIVGYILVDTPVEAATDLTLLIALFLIVGGLVRIVISMTEQFAGWGWSLLNGIVTLLLGMLIYRQWPLSGLIVIGLFIGIEMIFNGWYWIMLALGLKKAPQIEQASAE
jgi:uncharacterized membrane protein HdeD (DUF308 family)